MKQFFYLVVCNYDQYTFPEKIFLQEHEAIKWGRKKATEATKEVMCKYEFVLYKQEITRNAMLKRVKILEPYKEETK